MTRLNFQPCNTIEAVVADTRYTPKILVRLAGTLETLRWGKVVHIDTIRRLPKIHNDGTVTIRDRGEDRAIRAESTEFTYFSDRQQKEVTTTLYQFHIA